MPCLHEVHARSLLGSNSTTQQFCECRLLALAAQCAGFIRVHVVRHAAKQNTLQQRVAAPMTSMDSLSKYSSILWTLPAPASSRIATSCWLRSRTSRKASLHNKRQCRFPVATTCAQPAAGCACTLERPGTSHDDTRLSTLHACPGVPHAAHAEGGRHRLAHSPAPHLIT